MSKEDKSKGQNEILKYLFRTMIFFHIAEKRHYITKFDTYEENLYIFIPKIFRNFLKCFIIFQKFLFVCEHVSSGSKVNFLNLYMFIYISREIKSEFRVTL